jgi:hypothetical protein
MAEFKKKQPNVTINVTMTQGDQYTPKLPAALNAGSGPDHPADSTDAEDADDRTIPISD